MLYSKDHKIKSLENLKSEEYLLHTSKRISMNNSKREKTYENKQVELRYETKFILIVYSTIYLLVATFVGATVLAMMGYPQEETSNWVDILMSLLAGNFIVYPIVAVLEYNMTDDKNITVKDSLKYSLYWNILPILVMYEITNAIRGIMPKKQEKWYKKLVVADTFNGLTNYYYPNTPGGDDVEKINKEVLDLLNTEVEVKTSQDIGYMTYFHVLLRSDENVITVTTTDFELGDNIEDLGFKRFLIKDEKLDDNSLYELTNKLITNMKNQEKYQQLTDESLRIEESEKQRLKSMEYVQHKGKEYLDSIEEGKKLRGDNVMKDKWEQSKQEINSEKVKLKQDLSELKDKV